MQNTLEMTKLTFLLKLEFKQSLVSLLIISGWFDIHRQLKLEHSRVKPVLPSLSTHVPQGSKFSTRVLRVIPTIVLLIKPLKICHAYTYNHFLSSL